MTSPFRSVVTAILLVALFLPPTVLSSSGDKKRTVRTTAYTHSEADHIKYGRKAATGTTLRNTRSYTSAAADWSRFPVGTTFRIKGSSTNYVIDDYGSALVGTDTIDLYHPSMSSMNRWGVRHVDIEITKFGDYERSREILAQRTKYRHCRTMLASIPKASNDTKNHWWSRKPKQSAPAADPAPTPKPEPRRAPETSTAPLLASAGSKETKKRSWFWKRKSEDATPAAAPAAAPAPKPQPAPVPKPQPHRAPVMLASNTSQPTPPAAPSKPSPAPQPKREAPAPVPESSPATVQLASATPSPVPAPASAPTAPATATVTVAISDTTPATATPLPTAAVPRVRAVKPISAHSIPVPAAALAVAVNEPVATARRPDANPSASTVSLASVEAPAVPIIAVARPNSPVPHRKREFRALPANWQPTAIN